MKKIVLVLLVSLATWQGYGNYQARHLALESAESQFHLADFASSRTASTASAFNATAGCIVRR